MLALLKYWQPIVSFFATASVAWLLHTADVNRIEAKAEQARAEQQHLLEAKCNEDKRVTEESSHGYQAQLNTLTDKYAALKRMHPARCVVPTSGQTAGGATSTAEGRPAGQNGLSSESLMDYAEQCEGLRLQVISLQGFINKVWKANGQ